MTDKRKLDDLPMNVVETLPLWQLDVVELTGHNLEARGREEVNQLLGAGWRLLHIYTLKYHEDDVWRERPMAILGRLRNEEVDQHHEAKQEVTGNNLRSSNDRDEIDSLDKANTISSRRNPARTHSGGRP
jgi:hypothetical protein